MSPAPKNAKPTNAERPARRRDADVLNAAARVFARDGYASATIQDVADELGILKGSLYHYIKTKEDLLFWLLEEVHQAVEDIMEDVAAQEELAPLDRLALYVRRQVLYNVDNLERISIYYHDMDRLGDERRTALLGRRRAHERFVAGLIRQAQQDGDADDTVDARLLGNCIFSTIIWTYRWYRPGRTSRQDVADACARYALSGVVGPRA